jgi:uncharacterized FlaG/YvyC family protein
MESLAFKLNTAVSLVSKADRKVQKFLIKFPNKEAHRQIKLLENCLNKSVENSIKTLQFKIHQSLSDVYYHFCRAGGETVGQC